MENKTEKILNDLSSDKKPTSMSTLIVWNISKALKNNPSIDLKSAIRVAQERLEHDSHDLDMIISDYPEDRHVTCAVLAWQQLGHHNADSLYEFIERKKNEIYLSPTVDNLSKDNYEDTTFSLGTDSVSVNSCTMGPVVKLPTQTSIVMRLESVPNARPKKPKPQEKDIISKIEAACCLDSACLEKLTAVDKVTNELRTRATKLAKRESERVELLERAEAAWKDLELGYQRRLVLAEEKEEDMIKQVERLIEERNGNKDACTELAKHLKERGDIAEKDRARLTQVEKDIYDRACVRLRLNEEAARADSLLAEQQCKAAHHDRDLQYKEEQARRKVMTMESEAHSTRTLTHDAERAMRSELGDLREQIAKVSNQLLDEDKDNSLIKLALDQLREEKMELIEDLDGCKIICDNRMQGNLDKLKTLREQVNALKDKVMECRCKLPIDEAVEVKRTPSLAALCHCSPEDKLVESCSCTSLRSKLMSNLFSDLFGGLQAELGNSGIQMPCQLLKCLEDKHNWDRASIVKTNLRNYFSKLLMGELDIAIATAIEKYHARWVGTSCADQAKLSPKSGESEDEGWQGRALERKAQKLATKLAEELFNERAEQIERRVKDIVASGPPPCDCGPKTAAFTCMVKQNMHVNESKPVASAYWQRTVQDVTQLRLQIEDLKKDSIKKQDLKIMEKNISKIVQRTSGLENVNITDYKNIEPTRLHENHENEPKTQKVNMARLDVLTPVKLYSTQKKPLATSSCKKEKPKNGLQTQLISKFSKPNKKFRQEYAVNMCLCSNTKNYKKQAKLSQNLIVDYDKMSSGKQKAAKDFTQVSSIRHTKPINTRLPSTELAPLENNKDLTQDSCFSNCICFHKIPSNTSIDKLFETLARWKFNLEKPDDLVIAIENQTVINATDNNNNKIVRDFTTDLKKSSKSLKIVPNYSKIPLNTSKASISLENDCSVYRNTNNNIENLKPINKESVYMGAINLDKSKEFVCKCVKDRDVTIPNLNTASNNKDKTFSLRCINSRICTCEKYQVQNNANMNQYSLEIPQYAEESKVSDLKVLSLNESQKEIKVEKNKSNILLGKILKISDSAQKGLVPYDCDYHINFLGTTLTNNRSTKSDNESFTNFEKKEIYEEPVLDPGTVKSVTLNSSINKIQKNICQEEYEKNCCTIQSDSNNEKITNCNCKVIFEELKDCIREVLDKKTTSTQEESMGTDTVQLSVFTHDDCVCCINTGKDESENLEENTFQLIEEYLKEKLEKFRTSFCKSSCISPAEEVTIFSTILNRVKEVISNSARNTICKCPGDEKSDGSWNRAFGLLQEYLKMKIKRVQCSCDTSSAHNDMVISMQTILEKVCLLIENDFERLKNICNCKNLKATNELNTHSAYKNIISDHLLQNKTYCKKSTDTKSKQNSNGSIILTQNMSSQVPQFLGMESTFCNAMEKESKNIQTQDSKYVLYNQSCKTSLCDCSKNQNNEPFMELLGRNELSVNHCTKIKTSNMSQNSIIDSQSVDNKNIGHILNKKSWQDYDEINLEQQTKIPYIGTTVDCSCFGTVNSCVCMKSVIKSNNDSILSMWNRFTHNKLCVPNVSYMMNSTIDRSEQEKNDILNLMNDIYGGNITDLRTMEPHPQTLCDIKLNTLHSNEEMVLINSKQKFNQIHNMTNTYSESSNIDDPIDWYDCKRLNEYEVGLNNVIKDIIDSEGSKLEEISKINVLNKNEKKILNSQTKVCNCSTIPVCHVKMLVESIENKLMKAQCTCDSLTPVVCPVHAAGATA